MQSREVDSAAGEELVKILSLDATLLRSTNRDRNIAAAFAFF